MAEKKVMSAQITPFTTMCPSSVWCRRGDRTIVPLSSVPPGEPASTYGCPLFIHGDTRVR